MLNDFSWNMTGYIPKHQVNPHGDGIIPYVAERIFQLEPEPPVVGNVVNLRCFIYKTTYDFIGFQHESFKYTHKKTTITKKVIVSSFISID